VRTQQKLRIEAEAAFAALAAAVAADARAAAADVEASRCAAALAVAEAQAEALRVDRSEGRVKLQARWGARGQWVSFKMSRSLALPALKAKLAAALLVELEELARMDLHWRDDAKGWCASNDRTGLAQIVARARASNRDTQSKRCAKSCHLADPARIAASEKDPSWPRSSANFRLL
jgi:hypothetical protein